MAMFPHEYALPRTQAQLTPDDRQTQRSLGEQATHVGWHVVGPFGGMRVAWIAIRHQIGEKGFQIAQDVRVGVFTDQERGRGVLYKDLALAGMDAGLVNLVLDLAGDFDQTASAGLNFQKCLAHAWQHIQATGGSPPPVAGRARRLGCTDTIAAACRG